MKKLVFIFAAILLAVTLHAPESNALINEEGPVLLITAEYTPYERLAEPDIVELFKKYNVWICLCVREDQLDEDLDHLYKVYEEAGIAIIFWPLLPLDQGLYLNKNTTDEFLAYLDVLFRWADEHGHKIEALIMDVEPSFEEPEPGEEPEGLAKKFMSIRKELGRDTFDASIPEFEKIIEKIHDQDCLAVGVAFPFVIDDRLSGIHAWEDLFGGPVATVEWDYIAIMMYTSWFVEWAKVIGMDWDSAHYLAYDYSKDMKEIWGDKAAVAIGVTSPGQAGEIVVYESPEMIAPALAAVKAAGIDNLGIYDMKGILESKDPESWFKVLTEIQPAVPEKGRRAAKRFRKIFRKVGKLIEKFR